MWAEVLSQALQTGWVAGVPTCSKERKDVMKRNESYGVVRAQDEILALALASCVALGRLSGPLCRSFPICNVANTVVPLGLL